MAVGQDPRTGIWYGWAQGDNDYATNLNANLKKLGLLHDMSATSRTTSSPPGSPFDGELYIVGPSGTGAWSGYDEYVAIWVAAETAWSLYAPRRGYDVFVEDEGLVYRYTGAAWAVVTGIGAGTDNRLARYDGAGAVQSSGINVGDDDSVSNVTSLSLLEKSSDPSDPAEGNAVIWMSDGTGTGDDGDILIKITAGSVTKTATLIDFSAI